MDIPVDFVFFQKSPRHFASANKVFSHSGLSVETTETKNGGKFVWDSKVVLLFDVFFFCFLVVVLIYHDLIFDDLKKIY